MLPIKRYNLKLRTLTIKQKVNGINISNESNMAVLIAVKL